MTNKTKSLAVHHGGGGGVKRRTLSTVLAALFAAAIFAVFSSCGDPTDNGGTEPSVPSVSSYTVTFNANGGSAVANQTVTEGAKITEPTPAPAQAGKTFAGWYTDTAFNTKWNFAVDTVSAATTLYAKWVEGENVPSYTVTFNANGGSAVDPQTIVQGEPAQKPPNPTKAGHIFDAWYKEAGFTTEWNFAVDTVTSNTALYAKWTEAFTVTFDSNGGSAVPTLTRAAGEYVYLDGYRSATAKSGYIFDGWYTDQA
ncbi:MAG: InlB B-repeat-containing protein, partial [Treponema sp.]|nr:InlB B-repeat-containing protein [Treponema sp.]